MRTLSDTLLNAQKSPFVNSLVKIVLTYDVYTYTYTKPRILSTKETEDGSLQSFEIELDNSDGSLTELNLQGYKAALSFGAATTAGDEYSQCAAMWVMGQEFSSDPNKLTCTISVIGICNLMSQDEASEKYMPDDTDTKSVKTLVNAIIGATLDCFSLCTAYEVVWDAGYDPLADTYKPKDAFRIYVGNNRMSAINRLLEFTLNVAVAKNDGKVHIFKPTTSGETYDYQYSLDSGQHQFFSKALRNRLVTPNYIKVQSREDDDPQYSGTATDAGSFARLPKAHFKNTYLESDDQAQDIAEAILAMAQMWCEAGAANVPMNVGAEAFDYVKVTDSRESDYRVGNTGKIIRRYNVTKNEWSMSFLFGNWQNVRKVLANLNITGDDIENYFARLSVADLYVENLLVENMGFYWLDPDNTIDITKIHGPGNYFDLDNLPNGEQYVRVSTWNMSLDEDPESPTYGLFVLNMDEHTIYQPGYNPSEKRRTFTATPTTPYDIGDLWLDADTVKRCITARASGAYVASDWMATTLDAIENGAVFSRVKSMSLSAAGLVLLDQVEEGTFGLVLYTDISAGHILLSKTTKDGLWYDESGVAIDATKGIGLYGGVGLMGLRTYPTLADYIAGTNVQCYVGTDGKLYAGGGNVRLDSSRLSLTDEMLYFYRDSFSNYIGKIYAYNITVDVLAIDSDGIINLYADSDIILNATNVLISASSLKPNIDNTVTVGTTTKQFYGAYFASRLKIPVGTDMYD